MNTDTRVSNRRLRRLVAVAGLFALVAAGCGDDGDDTAETDTTAGTDTTVAADGGASGTPIKIGALVDESGPVSTDTGASRAVSEAWADHLNAEGGIGGHPVEIVFKDTAGDPAAGTAAAAELIADDSVVGVFAVDISGEGAFGPSLSEAGLPVIGGNGVNPTLWGALPHFYSVTTHFPEIIASQPISAQELAIDSLASGICAEVAACRGSDQILSDYAEGVDVQVAATIELAAANVDYNAECLQFKESGAGLIQLSVTNAVALRVASDCLAQGFDGWFGATSTTLTADLYNQDGLKVTGGISSFPWWTDAAPVAEYRSIMTDADVAEDVYGNPTATSVYATLELFRTAIAANKALLDDDTLSRQDVIDAYATVADEDLDGLISTPLTFDDTGVTPINTCMWIYTSDSGEFSGGDQPVCLGDLGLDG